MIKIGFDARMIRHSGIGTYIRGVLKHLVEKTNLDLTLFGDLVKIANYPARKVLADFPIYSIREQVFFPKLLRKNPVQLLHVPHYNAPLGVSGPLIITLHDLIHLKFPPSRLAYFYARGMIEAVCKKAKVILVDSQNTKQDLLQILGSLEKKIQVVYPAVSEEFLNPPSSPINGPSPSLPKEPYLLYVGNVRPTKNIKILIESFLLAKKELKDLSLRIVGKDSMPEYTRAFKDRSDIRWLGEIPTAKLFQVYREARIFIFPSLYEGFGLPPLEAMASGVPVISSNAASLPEVVGDSALLFDPRNPQELADLIIHLWRDDAKIKELIFKGKERVKQFSWKRCADEIAQVYQECI